MALICPVTGLKVFSLPEWIRQKASDTHISSIQIINDSIIYSSPKGYADLKGAQKALAIRDKVTSFASGGNGPYVQIEDFTFVPGSSLAARKYYINKMNNDKRILSLIFCNLSQPWPIAIKIGKRFNITGKNVHVTRHYSDAVKLALKIIGQEEMKLDSTLLGLCKCLGYKDRYLSPVDLLSEDAWNIQTPEYSHHAMVVDQCVLYATPHGHIKSKHIPLLEHTHHLIQSAIHEDSIIKYIVLDCSRFKGASRSARNQYMKFIKSWHQRFPLRMFIVYGANTYMKTALHMARPLMTFDLKIAKDIDHVFHLIRNDKSGNVSKKNGVQESEKAAVVSHEDIEKIMTLISSLDWDSQGIDNSFDLVQGHPLYFLFQSIKLIKEELDDLFKKRKQAEESALQSEKRFRDLFESISDLIYTQDLDGRFISTNPSMQRLFGYDEDEFIGRRAADFMKPESRPYFDSEYLEGIKSYGYYEGISSYFKKDGSKIYIEYRSTFVEPSGGDPYISGMGRDVTDKILSEKKLKKLQEQIVQTQKMETIGTLSGGIAHDFNNILFPILGHAEMLLEDVPEDSPMRASLNEVYSGALRARELIKQILTFSRQESNEIKIIKIQPIIQEALKLIRSTIPATISINQSIQVNPMIIKADPTQIHQVVMNLATNAYHAMGDTGGMLKVDLKQIELGEQDLIDLKMKPGIFACLTVADTGMGIDRNVKEKIFDPFFTTKEQGKGTGMGLSVVHGIVESAGGGIQVQTEPGKGTAFHVYFPVIQRTSEQREAQTKEPIQGGTERILLVDDEEAIVFMEKQMLERLGYQVVPHTSSLETLEAFRLDPDKFDVVITDMSMPNMSGDQLASELIKIRSDIPIVLCTGFSAKIPQEEVKTIGIKGLLMKPIVRKDLSIKIREVLDEAKDPSQQ